MSHSDKPTPRWTVSTMRHVAAEPTLTAAALRYASLGIPVFPCVPGGKQPLIPNGFRGATSQTASVHRWWDRNPYANIGLPTGARTGVVVVDVDVHPGGNGFNYFQRARSEGLAEGWGWIVRTPSGGLHAYYPHTFGEEQRSWQIPSAHVDFRGDGGYVIAPPSRVEVDGSPRSYYVIAAATHPAHPIDALKLRQLLDPTRLRAPVSSTQIAAEGCNPKALARMVAETSEGGRNRALFWAACRMVESNYPHAAAVSYLMPAAQQAGLPDREITTTIGSAFHIASRLSSASRPRPTRASEAIGL